MACSPTAGGGAGLQAMLNAFQQGSGLCGADISLVTVTVTVSTTMTLTAWFLYGQYRSWKADRDNGDEYFFNGAFALAFAGLFTAIALH